MASSSLPALDNTMGALFVGVLLGGVLWGVSCVQYWYYAHTYKNDGWHLKTMVAVAWLSDTVHQVLISHALYTYLVKNYFNPPVLAEIIWSMVIEVLFNGITALIVQTFFVYRIYHMSGQNVIVVGFTSFLIISEFVTVIVYVARTLPMNFFAQLPEAKAISITVNVLAATGDLSIAVALCYYLNKSRTGFRQSDNMLRKMMLFAVNTGILTSLCATASLIMITALPNTFIYICFYFTLGRLYINSLLATLNVRSSLRQTSEATHELSSLALEGIARRFKNDAGKGRAAKLGGTKTQETQLTSITFARDDKGDAQPYCGDESVLYGVNSGSQIIDVKATR